MVVSPRRPRSMRDQLMDSQQVDADVGSHAYDIEAG